ncbi:MAG: 5'-nucleotidase, lipoprotein e(P4) family [Clostridium sp.]|uniref:5'-nucleotidase, lipoprotein e(P4) family n=1 Tax=Clostridium sp. TaxID=1506 RepID=UPI003EE4CB5E
MKSKRHFLKGFFIFILGGIICSTIVGITCYHIYIKKLNTYNVSASKDQLGDYMKGAFNWLENSGEAESLEYQAFNSATTSLANMIKEPSSKPKAVILDIDETCLNNAPFQGYELLNDNDGFDYSIWNKWVNYAEATAIPGSVQFTQQANNDGVQIFYVSGRSQSELNATVKNLNKLGFAQANIPGHVILLPPNQSGKQPTFNQLEEKYDVVMFIGDQLTDMGSIMHGNSAEEKKEVTQYEQDWGSKFIAIPDPLYGNYIGALDDDKKLTPSQQIKVFNKDIQTFNPETGKVFFNK